MTNNPIKAIVFDYGEVINVAADAELYKNTLINAAAALNLTSQQLWDLMYTTDEWQQVKRGRISVAHYYNSILSPYGITDATEQHAYMVNLFGVLDRVHPEMAQLVRELKPRYKLAILSNTAILEMDNWLAVERDLAGIFDVVISSADVGMAKPEPEIYTLTIEKLGVQAHEALFVDDKVRNTNAAEALGIPSIVFTTPQALRQELVARGIL
jgi:epoxide hydrolase-like predicted phosphatase